MNPTSAAVAPGRTIVPAIAVRAHRGTVARHSALRIEVVFARPETIGRDGAHVVGPHLDLACALDQGAWWFLRRESGWHVHLDHVANVRARRVLDTLVERRVVDHWTVAPPCPSSVEPVALTGSVVDHGAVSCARIEPGAGLELHRADSHDALAYLRKLDRTPQTRRPLLRTAHVLGILARETCRSARLDDAASAGVLDALARRDTGGLSDAAEARAHGLAEMLTLLWRVPASDVLGSSITPWATALAAGARGLAAATDARADLSAGNRSTYLRAQLGRALAAQWDRLCLTVTEQTVLAVAVRDALRRQP